jgi:signal transduction histidine kinase
MLDVCPDAVAPGSWIRPSPRSAGFPEMTDAAIPFEAPMLAMTEGYLVVSDPESRLAEHLRRLSRLFRAAGHDLRGPLHAMALQLELLRQSAEETEDPELRARQTRYAAAIAREIPRLARMLEAFWGGADEGEGPVLFDLRETTEDIRVLFEPYCRRSQVILTVRVPEAPVEAEGSRAAVRHAGLDLLLHAMERLPGADLTLGAETRNGTAVLFVAASPKDRTESREGSDVATEEAPFAADAIARRHGGAIHARSADGVRRWELELPRPRTLESD